MRILKVHNFYQQAGGEDTSFDSEAMLLCSKGHEVFRLNFYNRDLKNIIIWKQPFITIWNKESYNKIQGIIRKNEPNVGHIHNIFPLASPSIIHAAKAEKLPLVMTLHNYRLLCPSAIFFRNGIVCEKCSKKIFAWPGIYYGCWNGKAPTAVISIMFMIHRILKSWEKIDLFIALTEFERHKFIDYGFSPHRIVVKPNFVFQHHPVRLKQGNYVLFIGRLSPEKGILTAIKAWRYLREIPLKIVGDGILKGKIEKIIQQEKLHKIQLLGFLSQTQVFNVMQDAQFLIFPSEWYEGFPRTIVESFSNGLPVLASRLGSMAEIVDDGRTGLLFNPQDSEDLAYKVNWAWYHKNEIMEMRLNALREYEAKYTPEKNYEELIKIYKKAILLNEK